MILVLCNDDPAIQANAILDAAGDPAAFGQVFQPITAVTPQLGANEDLFITAHGIQGEIGNEDGALGYNAQELLKYLTNTTPNDRGGSVFPAGYTGNVYISACYSGNVQGVINLTFSEQFYNLSRDNIGNSSVYGQRGAAPMRMPVLMSTPSCFT